jgi:hypothetical protein
MTTAEVVSRGITDSYDRRKMHEMVEELTNRPIAEYYSPEVYRAADKALKLCAASYDAPTVKIKNQSVGPTNALIRTIQAEFVGPLNQIANLHARVIAAVMDMDLISRVDAVFSRILTLAPPVDDKSLRPQLRSEREEYGKRASNILFSQFKPLMMDLTIFLRKKYGIKTNGEAIGQLLGCQGSIADSIALLAMDRLTKVGPTGTTLLTGY